jgi:hypothetical protein
MVDTRILTNRQWHIDGNWFAPKRFIKENFASVVYCDYMEMTSSAGDWTGLIIQKLGNNLYVTVFSQENTFPCNNGFDVHTDSHISTFHQDVPSVTNYTELFNEICAIIYENEMC